MSPVPRPDEAPERVVAYTTPWCGYCVAARRLLEKRNIAFSDIDVSGNRDARRWLADASGRGTVPQIFVDGRSVGGFSELRALDQSGALAAGLAGAG